MHTSQAERSWINVHENEAQSPWKKKHYELSRLAVQDRASFSIGENIRKRRLSTVSREEIPSTNTRDCLGRQAQFISFNSRSMMNSRAQTYLPSTLSITETGWSHGINFQ